MSKIKKRKDCPSVEQFMWDKVLGDFDGIRRLSIEELWGLKKLCGDQIAMIEYDKRKEKVDVDHNV